MAYDVESGRTILFGGFVTDVDPWYDAWTWAYDYRNDTWTDLRPPESPPWRFGHAMAYDRQSDVVVLFGGLSSALLELDDTWAYDYNSNTWREMAPAAHPSALYDHDMAYDYGSDRTILFGGPNSDETWAYDYEGNNWTLMNPYRRPSVRFDYAMAYSDSLDRVFLFAGFTLVGDLEDDTWTYDYETDSWERLVPAFRPSGRFLHGMAYDARGDCIVMFGGLTEYPEVYDNETWTYPACHLGGDVVMSTDKSCYDPGEAVEVTATGWAKVPAIGDFPNIFWVVEDASGAPVFETRNYADQVRNFTGTLKGKWDQTYRLFSGNLTGPVPPGSYLIRFYELPRPGESPPDWVVPARIQIMDCPGEDLPEGDVVMGTDKVCYAPGEPVEVTATGWAWVPSIGSFPDVFWWVADETGGWVFVPMNLLPTLGYFNGTLNGTWDQAYDAPGAPSGPVRNGTYAIGFYGPPFPGEPLPDWVIPATIKIGDCGGEVEAEIDFDPDTLNPKSNGKWVTVYIELPSSYDPRDIDASAILLNGALAPVLDPKYGFVSDESGYIVDHDGDGTWERMVKFDRAAVVPILPPGTNPVRITGRLADGTAFAGWSDPVRLLGSP
ncbi:MAG: kelch repeat-containing protein [Candidatus Thermoplasmatota archaeon]